MSRCEYVPASTSSSTVRPPRSSGWSSGAGRPRPSRCWRRAMAGPPTKSKQTSTGCSTPFSTRRSRRQRALGTRRRRGGAAAALRWSRLPLSGKVATVYAAARRSRRGSPLYRPHRPREPLARRTSPRLLPARGSPPFDPVSLTSRERLLLAALASVQRRWLFDATCLRRALGAGDPTTSPPEALPGPHRCRRRLGPRLAGCRRPHHRRAARGTCLQARSGTGSRWQRRSRMRGDDYGHEHRLRRRRRCCPPG